IRGDGRVDVCRGKTRLDGNLDVVVALLHGVPAKVVAGAEVAHHVERAARVSDTELVDGIVPTVAHRRGPGHRVADQLRRTRVRLRENRAGQRIGWDEHGPAIRKACMEPERAQIIEPRRFNKRIRPKAGDRGTQEGIARGNDLVHDAVLYTEDAGATR